MRRELHIVTSRGLRSWLPIGHLSDESLLLSLLRSSDGGYVSREKIIEVLWGHRYDGGPLTPGKVIHILVHRLRKRGWNVKNWYSGAICSYRPKAGSAGRAEGRADRPLDKAVALWQNSRNSCSEVSPAR